MTFAEEYLDIKEKYDLIGASPCGSYEWYLTPTFKSIIMVVRPDERIVWYGRGTQDYKDIAAILNCFDLIS